MSHPKIFISYRRNDHPDTVARIYDRLVGRYEEQNVFLDFETIPPFTEFAAYIRERIHESTIVVAIIGPRWLELLKEKHANYEEDFVKIELSLAIELGKVIAPICIVNAQIPRDMDLPPELRPMLKYNAALLPSGRDFNPNMLRIMDGIDQSLHTSPKPNAEKIQPISQRTAALAAYQRGRTQYDERRYDAALTSFTEFLGVFPEDSSAFHYRGMIYMMRKEYHKAIADFTQAIRFRSDDAVLYHNRGGACFYLKDYEGAIANFREALRFQPDDKLAYYRRGTAYLERQRAGDFADAISDFNQAIRLGYKTSEVFERRGLARMHEKDFNGAIQDFSEAIRLKPDEPLYYFQRAEACVRKKDYKGAIANYTEAIRFNARYVEAYNGRGLARLALGKSIELDVSIEDFTQAILYGHDHPMLNTFYNNRGIAWINKNNPKKAIEDHSHAIRLKPADPIAYRLRSEVYQQQGDSALAAKDADEARRLEGLQSE